MFLIPGLAKFPRTDPLSASGTCVLHRPAGMTEEEEGHNYF